MQELQDSIRKLEAAAQAVMIVAYEGYVSGGAGVVSPGGQKHGMVEGGIKVRNERMHKELQNLKREAASKAREIDGIAGKYNRIVWDQSPREPIGEEQLEGLERYEKKRRGLTS